MTNLFASIKTFRDGIGTGVKAQYQLGTGPGGGDGMDFAAGTEVFQWNSENIPYGKRPGRIVSLWVDASQIATTKNLAISIQGGQTLVIQGGSQGYYILTASAPFTMTITSGGGTGVVQVTAYNYNALFTGTSTGGAALQTGSGGAGDYPQSEAQRARRIV